MRPFEPKLILKFMQEVFPYLSVTLEVTIAAVFLGMLFGAILTYLKLYGNKWQSAFAESYTYVMRCTPSIVLLFIVFYGLPKFFLEVFIVDINNLSRAIFVIVTFTLLSSAAISEVFRAAYLAIDKGQYEAAVSMGLSSEYALLRIVLPQAAVVALPNFCNTVLNLIKEGSLAYTIGLIDLLGAGQLIISRSYGASALEVYIAVGLIYWALAVIFSKIALKLELYFAPQHLKIGR